MRNLETIVREVQALQKELTDTIAAKYPKGSTVLVRSKHGWDTAEVTWTPEGSNGANPHIHVKRLRTGGERKINLLDVSCDDMVRKWG